MIESLSRLPVAVIGAGPVGLTAAAHCLERGLPVKVYEAGAAVAANVRDWGHVRLFSPWEFNIDPAARRILLATGWSEPPADGYPTGHELVEAYLAPLAAAPEMAAIVETASLLEQHRQGEMTRQLAAWAAILAVPTAIAGIYGMNFEYIPELKWRFGYFLIWGVILSVCGGLWYRFRRIGWL